jgi:fructose-bisphosphate aldolase, class I
MDARTGKKIRLGRLFNQKSHKTLIVAYSHGVLMGPRPGMKSLDEMKQVSLALGRADGLMIAPGLVGPLEESYIGRDRPSLIVHLDYQSFSRDIMPYEQGATVEMGQIEDIVAAGADGVMTYLYMGYDDPEREKMEIARNARLARACERWGIILMIEPRSAREARNPADKTDPRILGLYCRVSAEIGADLLKCIHPGDEDALRSVIEGCTAPVLVAGGSRAEKPKQAYARAESALRAGAAGLVYGRNIYEASDPVSELERYLKIVHG